MAKAIIFDFDGTILDTETPSYEVWKKIYQRYDIDLPIHIYGQFVGTKQKNSDPFSHLQRSTNLSLIRDEIEAEKRKELEIIIGKQNLLAGVQRLIEEAKQRKMKLGVASSSSRDWVVDHLKRTNLFSWFDVIKTRDDVSAVKPDPELYLQALDALKVKPQEAIAIEDSPNGAIAAQRAGIRCIVVPNPLTKQLAFAQVDTLLDSLEDLDLNWL